MTPLHKAAIKGHVPMVELLLSHGADVNMNDDVDGCYMQPTPCIQPHMPPVFRHTACKIGTTVVWFLGGCMRVVARCLHRDSRRTLHRDAC